ncbi:tape measure protein [Limosilactobacillus vaginalis]|uniref:tape measure protein n=1 Tax=Limosilactobacillus vaginalis TaxID=1633 RepID=UPI003F21995B
MATVQAKMATEVALDLVQASTAIKNLTSAVSASTSAWKSQQAYLRSVGDYAGAARAKYNGLGEAMDAQRRKIEALEEKQRSMSSISTESATKYLNLKKQIDATRESMGQLDTSTEAGKAAQKSMQATIDQLVSEQKKLNVGTVDSAREYLNFGRQIDQANAKLASMRAQQQRAAQQMDIEDSGVRRLSASMRAQQGLVSATVERLRSQGQAYQALETDLNGTRQRLTSLQAIQQREISLLNQTKERFGENSDQYAKQATRVQQLGTQISETSSKVNELNERMRRTPSGWLGNVQQRLNGIQSGADRVSTSFGRIFGATAAANMFTGALASIQGQLGGLVRAGAEYDITQNKMVATWTTLTGSASKANPMIDSINKMSQATGQNVDVVNELEQGFYHLNSSKKQADSMTSSLLNMADAVGLNSDQIQAVEQDMVHGMATGKITQGELNQIGQYFPMIDEAMAKHFNTTVAGMRQMAKAGKVSAKDLQEVFTSLGNGEYKAAAENMMNSYFGVLRTIKARTPQLIGDIEKPFMTMSNPVLQATKNWVNDKRTDAEFTRFGNHAARALNQVMTAFGGSKMNFTDALDNGLKAATNAVDELGNVVARHHTQITNFFSAFKEGSTAQIKIFANVLMDLSKVLLPVLDVMARFPKTSAALVTGLLLASRAVRTLQASINGIQTIKNAGSMIQSFGEKVRRIPSKKTTSIQVNGAQSTRELENYSRRLDRVPKRKTTTVTANTAQANRNLNATQRQAQRIPRRVTTTAVANTTQARGNLTRLGTTAMRSGTTAMRGMSLVSRGAGIAKLGLAALGGPAGVIGLVTSGFVTLYQTNGKFRKWVNGIVSGAKKAGGALFKYIGNGVKGAMKFLGNLWNSAKKGMGHFVNSIKSGMSRASKSMSNGYSGMDGATSRWSSRHTKTWSDTANSTANIASNSSSNNQGIVADMHNRLNDRTLRGTAAMIAKWNNHFAQLESTILGAKNPVHSNFSSVMGGIAGPFGVIINGIAKGINWILDKVGGSGHLGTNFTFDGFANGTPNGGLLHDQIALLNDGNGPHYQEMIHKKSTGQTFMLPAQRNMLLPLEAGDEVLDGEKSHQLATMMGMPIPHADGAIGNFFSGIWDNVSDAASDAMDWVEKALKNVVEFGTETFNHFVNAMSGPKDNGHFFSMGVHEHTPHYIAVEGEKWLKKQLESMNADAQGYVSKEKFAQIARHAASLMHQSLSDGDIDHLYWQGNVESGDGANMGAGVDDHDGTGRPLGFYQYKLSTWNSWAVPGHTKIMSILDQTMAVLNDSNWRSDLAPIGTRRGWGPTGHKMFANGGIATTPSIFGEAGAEMAIPLDTMKSTRAWQLMRQVVDYYAGNSANGTTQVTTQTDLEPIEKRLDAALSQNQQLINLLDKLIGVTDAVNNPTARYRRTQRDINMAQAQSLGGY